MSASHDEAVRIFSDRAHSYVRFVKLFAYPQGIRAFFRASPLLRSRLRVLDAGCGTGIVTLALRDALSARGFEPAAMHAFDLTPAMLERFREALRIRSDDEVELARADVLDLGSLPAEWTGYDLIVSASMMEYLPRERLPDALAGLRARMKPDGRLVLFITRRNALMAPLIGRWWDAHLYRRNELKQAFDRAGFASVEFRKFPLAFRYLDLWGHAVEATG